MDARNSADNIFATTFIAPAKRWYNEMNWTRERPRVSTRKRYILVLSYAPDWLITFFLAALVTILADDAYGFRREFSLTDPSIQHTYAVKERVSVTLLAITTVLIPALIISAVSLGVCRSVWDWHAGLLGLVLTHAITLTVTTVIKITVGRPRPDFIDRCRPASGATNGVPFGLVTEAICTRTDLLKDGFRSLPSGHASTAFAGCTFLSLYLAGKLHLFHPYRGHAAYEWVVVIPLLGAALIGISRSMDYRHSGVDIFIGMLLGIFFSLITYHLYYPHLTYAESHKPWPPRTSRPSLHPDREGDGEEVDIERTLLTPSRAEAQTL